MPPLPPVPLRALGRTGLRVPCLTLGAQALASAPDAVATARRAIDRGITLLESTPALPASEAAVGAAVEAAGARDRVLLLTRVGDHPGFRGFSADAVRDSVHSSMDALRTKRLDFVVLDSPEPDELEAAFGPGGAMDAIAALRAQRLVRYVGLRSWSAELLDTVMRSGHLDVFGYDLLMLGADHNLLLRDAEDTVRLAGRLGIGVVNGGPACYKLIGFDAPHVAQPLGSSTGLREQLAAAAQTMWDWCAERESEGAQEAGGAPASALQKRHLLLHMNMSWVLDNPAVGSYAIPARTPDEVDECVRLAATPMPAHERDRFHAYFFPSEAQPSEGKK